MAQRRMFTKTIVHSSAFLQMPHQAQLLYFHLGMSADDDGFAEHFMVMRLGCFSIDTLKILQAKGFVHVFDENVLLIKNWSDFNKIQPTRKVKSLYMEVYSDEMRQLSINCQQNVTPVEYSKVENSKVKKSKVNTRKSFKLMGKDAFVEEVSKLEHKIHHEDFIRYWTEENEKGKMKFQLCHTWSTGGRLATWSGNNFNKKQATHRGLVL